MKSGLWIAFGWSVKEITCVAYKTVRTRNLGLRVRSMWLFLRSGSIALITSRTLSLNCGMNAQNFARLAQ